MFKSEKGFSLVELAVAAAAAVTIGAIAVTAATGTSAVISSKARTGKTTADSYNSSVVSNPDVAVATGLVNLFVNGDFETSQVNIGSAYGGWRGTTAGIAHSGIGYANSGQNYLPVFDNSGNEIGSTPSYSGINLYSPGYNPPMGKTYSISFWIKCPGGKDPVVANFLGSKLTITIPPTWTYYKIENVTNTSSIYAMYAISLSIADTASTVQNPFYVDDVSIVEGPVAP
jgi:hypothetical protein